MFVYCVPSVSLVPACKVRRGCQIPVTDTGSETQINKQMGMAAPVCSLSPQRGRRITSVHQEGQS